MKLTTRLRVLDIIRRQQTATVDELRRMMGMTGANIRHHLAILEANDLIQVVGQRKEGRGRPGHIYGISPRVLGNGLGDLVEVLLDETLADVSEETRQRLLVSMAKQLAKVNSQNAGPFLNRLAAGVRRLNELHYFSHWEAGPAGPRVILGYCPYREIINDHPELCRMDAYLMETLLEAGILQTEKLQPGERGLPYCSFLVKVK